MRRLLQVLTIFALVWGALVIATGGIQWRIAGVLFRSRDPGRALWILIAVVLLQSLLYRQAFTADLAGSAAFLRRAAPWLAATAALVLGAHGFLYGAFVAGGADSFGYISQAYGWATGHLPDPYPLPLSLPFPTSDLMQTPLGYHPGPQEHTMVPLYSPGLPLLMAAGLHLAGTIGPYLVVPISAAVYVWFTFLLGRRAAGSIAGVFAAVLVATSPAVLFQTMSPMSDVPSGALWTGATVAALGGTTRRAMLSGLLCALGLLVRPNLAVLALVPIGAIVLDARGAQRLVRPMLFAVPVALAALFVAYLNVHWHGSAMQSGYGPTADLYSLSRIWPNLQRYPVWLWQSQSPWIVVALLALVNAWRPGAGRRAVQASWVLFLLTAICYLSYFLFDEWWYLRFLLPGLGAFFVLVAVGLIDIARRVSRPWGQVAAALVFLLMLKHATGYALAHSGGFGALQAGEHRYPDVGAVVSAALPDNAVVFTMQHSGSLRFYGGRMTLRYDWVEPEWAARAVPELERMGLHPYLVIEDWEVPDVQKHFALAPDRALPWPQLHENGYVSLYDMATNPAPQPRIAIGAYTAPRYSAPKEMVLKPH